MAPWNGYYEVIVGNVGTVYQGEDILDACDTYEKYVRYSKKGEGRCGDECVTMLRDGEITNEHIVEK